MVFLPNSQVNIIIFIPLLEDRGVKTSLDTETGLRLARLLGSRLNYNS